MKKKICVLILMGCIALWSSGCVLNNGTNVYDNENLIVEDYDRYSLVQSRQSVQGNRLAGSAEKLEGMGRIWKFRAEEDTDIQVSYRFQVSSGKAKLVLISPDDKITILTECAEESEAEKESSETVQVKKGENRIKLIGAKDTEIDYEISVDKGQINSFGDSD